MYRGKKKNTVSSFKDPVSEVNEFQCLRETTSHKLAQEKSLILTAYLEQSHASVLGTSLVVSFHTDKDRF